MLFFWGQTSKNAFNRRIRYFMVVSGVHSSNAFVAGTLRGYFLPVRYGSVGVQLTRLRALYQGTLTSGCVWKNLNTSYLYNAAILASFFFIRVFKGVLSSEFVD